METIIRFQTTAFLCIIALEVLFSVEFLKAENFPKVYMIFVLISSYPTVCTDPPESNFILVYKALPCVKLKFIESYSFWTFITILQSFHFFFCEIIFNDNSQVRSSIHRGNIYPVLEETKFL